jgi:hypothetical protein
MTDRTSRRCFSLIIFESRSKEWLKPGGRITAAAYTGPASDPLPASSHPASNLPASRCGNKGKYICTKVKEKIITFVAL